MTATVELEAILREWLSEGPEHAPAEPVRRAVKVSERTSQRRPMRAWGFPLGAEQPRARSLFALLGATVLLVMLGVGIGVQVGLIRLPQPKPGPVPVATPSPLATDEPSTETDSATRTFAGSDGSYTISMPVGWGDRGVGSEPSVLTLSNGEIELSIRTANEGGRISTCDTGAGPWETCRTLDAAITSTDLADAIGLTPTPEEGIAPLGPVRTSMSLDGEPAAVISIEANEYPAKGAEFVKYVVAVHNGRPFIIRVWTSGAGGIPPAGELLGGFSFVDPEPSTEPSPSIPASEQAFETFRAPDGSFHIRLPAEWEVRDGPDATALYLGNGTTALSIRAGDANGRIRTCDTGAADWETCALVQPSTLDELADAVGLDADWPTAFVGPNESAVSLDGVPATSISIVASRRDAGSSVPIGVRYVVAIREGRPYIVRASQPTPPESHLDLMELLDGFAFR